MDQATPSSRHSSSPQLNALKEIQVVSFTRETQDVQPFSSAFISYVMKLPPGLTAVTFSINGQSMGQALSGSHEFTVSPVTSFVLTAVVEHASANIVSLEIAPDHSQCTKGTIPALFITGKIVSDITSALSSGALSKSPGAGGIQATPGDGTIVIQIPLDLDGQGSMNIGITLYVALDGQTVTVTSDVVTVQVLLNTSANVDSWCSNAMQEVVQPFVQHIADAEIDPAVIQGLMGQINQTIDGPWRQTRSTGSRLWPRSA